MKKKAAVEYYYKNKRPIAYSTKYTSDSLTLFKAQARSWEELKEMLPYGFEEKEIIDKYIQLQAPFNEVKFEL